MIRGFTLARTQNLFGRIIIGRTSDGRAVYPDPAFQRQLQELLRRTGGSDAEVTSQDFELSLGAPAGVPVSAPVSIGPVALPALDAPDTSPVGVSLGDCFTGDPV